MLESRRRRPRRPRQLAEAIARFRRETAPPTLLGSVQAAWARAVGEAIADQAIPATDRDGVITVRCRSGVWAAELTMLSGELAAQVNQALPEGRQVKALRFTVGGI